MGLIFSRLSYGFVLERCLDERVCMVLRGSFI